MGALKLFSSSGRGWVLIMIGGGDQILKERRHHLLPLLPGDPVTLEQEVQEGVLNLARPPAEGGVGFFFVF